MRPLADTEMTQAKCNQAYWAPKTGYGFICPGCLVRYGAEQPDKMVDVKRCAKCRHTTVDDIYKREESGWRKK